MLETQRGGYFLREVEGCRFVRRPCSHSSAGRTDTRFLYGWSLVKRGHGFFRLAWSAPELGLRMGMGEVLTTSDECAPFVNGGVV